MKGKFVLWVMLLLITSTLLFGQGNNVYIGSQACAACHVTGGSAPPNYTTWLGTKHAHAWDSTKAMQKNFECQKCHTTGWDPAAQNGGADEFVKQDTGTTFTITDTAKFAKIRNVQCEACHGPMGDPSSGQLSSTHWGFGTTNKPSYAATVCASCHQGSHDPFYEEWSLSKHAKSTALAFVVNNKACVKCHVAQNFVRFANNPAAYRDTILVTGAEITPVTCVTCHNPHEKKFTHQLRFAISGKSVICDQCHTAEIDSVDINQTPHHATSEIFSGKNFGFQYPGQTYTNSPHVVVVQDSAFTQGKVRCLACHMHTTPFNPITQRAYVGHTFTPTVEACIGCHSDYLTKVDTSKHDKMFDYRGAQTKTDSLMNTLAARLKGVSKADSATVQFKQANYNLAAAEAEGSHGIHNTQLVQKLLIDAINNFKATSVEQQQGLPTVFSLSQNYPNPFNPSTVIKFSIPVAGDVKLVVYDAIGNEVAILHEGFLPSGNYSLSWNGTAYSSGVYFYKLTSGNFEMVKKMLLVK